MVRTRKLQFIGDQFLLNIPRQLVRRFGWKKGDYFAIASVDRSILEIRKIADSNVSKSEALLPGNQQETMRIFTQLFYNAESFGPVEFSLEVAELSKLLGKLRRHRQKIPKLNQNNLTSTI